MRLHESIRQFCSEIGKDPLIVQGAGGNVSWKENNVLWIKASGTWLAHAGDKDIFVPVKLDHLTAALKSGDYAVIPQTVESTPLKPSIETLLHALMPHRIVVHVHAIEVLAHLVRKDFDHINYPALDKALNARTVKYCKPGAELAEAVANQLDGTSNTRVVFLKNHGVIIGGDNIDEISKTLEYLTHFFATPTVSTPVTTPDTSLRLANRVEFSPIGVTKLHEVAVTPSLVDRLHDNWALYPDHIVFLGPHPRLFGSLEEAKSALEQESELPDVIFVRDLGTFARETMNKAKMAQLICYYDVMTKLNDDAQLSTLTDAQISELIDWDAEKYRRGLNDTK
ncbi:MULTISPECIES: class II aldolase/adducin family protein [Pseudomonas]|jgi:rhamnose utilization protein RhaD (predicted bifunctional aldolase and dehydrogenase)|uniref:class II aldolase/adducin family protein n=1 Tax=Pseudomonas TaxID=286 RepID=UPI001D3A4D66|nr:class II aldolase/adducin family protein [Pseudomonas sp. Bi123]CAH0263527.1 Methylthioribulose-1-phosphate dehydratase [Pseudomonas sp. Bi123]